MRRASLPEWRLRANEECGFFYSIKEILKEDTFAFKAVYTVVFRADLEV